MVDGDVYDHLVIGAGPAGLQLARHLQESGSRYTVLEAGDAPGTFFATFPRHRTLISINKPHTGTDDPELNLRMDWNSILSDDPKLLFTRYTERYFPSADVLRQYLADFAAASDLSVHYDTRVVRIERPEADGPFLVTAQDGSVRRAAVVIVATGVSKPYIPPTPGIEHAEQYVSMPTDPADFTDQRVLILGKGNSAFETADNLIEKAAVIHVAGPDGVKLAWKTHYVGHLRAVNNNFLDTYQLKSQNGILDGEVLDITPQPGGGFLVRFSFARADEVVKELYYDRILCCTGFRLDTEPFFGDCVPALTIKDRFAELTPAFESVNVPGLYFAGTLMQQREFKKATTGFIHGFRYTVRALSRILAQRGADHVSWPQRNIEATPEALAAAVIERVNRSSALWQQFSVMADVILLATGDQARYFEEVPVGYALDGGLATEPDDPLIVVTLEYGPDHDKVDRFDVTVRRTAQDDPETAHDAAYLHPVVRVYRGGEVLAEHHLAENLENHWDGEASHRAPLVAFFEKAATL
ncbi:NAD(P)-binding domain-containing protein [Catenulispora pinistramenti]|uniref:NAD(P)-binding domain-containing protein n=1 Tax=Catenulispora pinistramenti TaxID=2705254 RepID=UPI001E2F6300